MSNGISVQQIGKSLVFTQDILLPFILFNDRSGGRHYYSKISRNLLGTAALFFGLDYMVYG